MAWTNGPLTVYHGTDSSSLSGCGTIRIGGRLNFTVQLSRCRPATDFGQGFYTTTSLTQAREWANARASKIRASPTAGGGAAAAVVLRFDLRRNRLARLDTLAFVRPTADFWSFVTYCRNGHASHNRGGLRKEYDVVYGPVTLWPQRLLIADCDQISFHSPGATRALGQPLVEDVALAPNGLFP